MIVRTLGTKPSYYVAVSDSKEEQGVPLINVEWRKIPKQETEAFEQLFSDNAGELGYFYLLDDIYEQEEY